MNVTGTATNGGLFPEDGRFEMQEIPGGGLGGVSVRECHVRGNQSWSAREDGGLRCKEARGVGLAGLVRLMSWRRPLVAHLGAKKPDAPVLDTGQAIDVVPCVRINVVDKTPGMVRTNGGRSLRYLSITGWRLVREARGIHNGDGESAAVFSKHRVPCEQRRAEREGRAWEAQEGRAVRAKEAFCRPPVVGRPQSCNWQGAVQRRLWG